jgi:hypothetical protein
MQPFILSSLASDTSISSSCSYETITARRQQFFQYTTTLSGPACRYDCSVKGPMSDAWACRDWSSDIPRDRVLGRLTLSSAFVHCPSPRFQALFFVILTIFLTCCRPAHYILPTNHRKSPPHCRYEFKRASAAAQLNVAGGQTLVRQRHRSQIAFPRELYCWKLYC